jgi:hypothetical protein
MHCSEGDPHLLSLLRNGSVARKCSPSFLQAARRQALYFVRQAVRGGWQRRGGGQEQEFMEMICYDPCRLRLRPATSALVTSVRVSIHPSASLRTTL